MSPAERTSIAMQQAIPYLFVADVDAALDFYVQRLGFELQFRHSEPECELAVIERDDVVLHVCTCGCDDKRHVGQSFFEVQVSDATALYEEYRAAQIQLRWDLQRHPWGRTDFTISDPEENWITFSGPNDDES